MHQLSLKGSLEEFQSLNGPSMREVVAILQKKHHLENHSDALYSQYSTLIEEAYREKVSFIPGSRGFLSAFKDKKLVIVTSSEKKWVEAVLEKEDMSSAFSDLITPIQEPGKPHPAIYLRALKEHNLDSSDVVTFEDSLSGVKASTSAGLATLRFSDDERDVGQIATFNGWKLLNSILKRVANSHVGSSNY